MSSGLPGEWALETRRSRLCHESSDYATSYKSQQLSIKPPSQLRMPGTEAKGAVSWINDE